MGTTGAAVNSKLSVVSKKGEDEIAGNSARAVSLDSEQLVPYLFNFLGGRWARLFAQDLHKASISFTAWRVLASVHQFGSAPLTRIAEFANFDLSTMSRVVDQLEAKRLIARDESKRQGRAVPIALTPAGQALMRRLIPRALEHEADLLAALSAAERTSLMALLEKIHQSVKHSR